MKILLASPSYDGNVRREYMSSVMRLLDYFREARVSCELCVEPATLLHQSRNMMATKALMEGFSHLLFVDTDMGFEVGAVSKLIAAGQPVVGCAYPSRMLPVDVSSQGKGRKLREVIAEDVPYAVVMKEGDVAVRNGVCEVVAIGTGLLLISTEALLQMTHCVKQFHMPQAPEWFRHDHCYGFFNYVEIGDRQLGEDYSFCWRWTNQCAGKVYAVVDEAISHIGPVAIQGTYLRRLRAGKK